MSIALLIRIQELEKKVAEQAKALEVRAVAPVIHAEHATKDDLDAFLQRLRALEGQVQSLVKKR